MRQIVLDTETTGLNPDEGHRIIEIGCVEMFNRVRTESHFHVYLNPQRAIDPGAAEVHGLSNEFLADKPLFADIVEDLLRFISGAEVIIHNAPFDVAFLNHELSLLPMARREISDYCTITDTLALAKRKHPGQRNSLDALCKRYDIDNSHREVHGALLDAEILAQVYLAMTGGQTVLSLEPAQDNAGTADSEAREIRRAARPAGKLKVLRCTEEEWLAHEARLEAIATASGGKCLWAR